ncbi:MAG: hypothetical protein FWE61_04510 [Micrococcales bacterium]|nr:hypothetical protein [Micrococcales bacterium]
MSRRPVDREHNPSGGPAHHLIALHDGIDRWALDPHDRRWLDAAHEYDPVVLSDDITLGWRAPVVATWVSAGVTVGWLGMLAVVDITFLRPVLVVLALVSALPAAWAVYERSRNKDGYIAIGSTGIKARRHGKHVHLAWVEIKRVRIITATYHRRVPSPSEVFADDSKVLARTQILLTPTLDDGFATHKGAKLLRTDWRRPLLRRWLRRPKAPAECYLVLRHRAVISPHSIPVAVLLADAAMRRFAAERYRGRPAAQRRRLPLLW